MTSTLVRFTSSKYADSYRSGDLYLSSLSEYWKMPRISLEELRRRQMNGEEMDQLDFREGVASLVPKDYARKFLPDNIVDLMNFDVGFRIEAYQYCNLLCFYRVDCDEFVQGCFDDYNLSYLLREYDADLSPERIHQLNQDEIFDLVEKYFPSNHLMSTSRVHLIHLPDKNMDMFGDMAVIVRDEEEFIRRVIEAVREQGGEVITGDVQYRKKEDRSNPEDAHVIESVLFISAEPDNDEPSFDLNDMIRDCGEVKRYGCLDKYERFAKQREWRVCWLPKERNTDGKILHVGRLDDIIEILPANQLRHRLMELNPGYVPGLIKQGRNSQSGTVRYGKFKKMVEGIDGKCRFMFEIGHKIG